MAGGDAYRVKSDTSSSSSSSTATTSSRNSKDGESKDDKRNGSNIDGILSADASTTKTTPATTTTKPRADTPTITSTETGATGSPLLHGDRDSEEGATTVGKKKQTALSPPKKKTAMCPAGTDVKEHTDTWGDALVWGTKNLVDSKEECCQQCAKYEPERNSDPFCNVWVYCGDKIRCGSQYRQCWLKYLAHPEGTAPAAEGPEVGWTTGLMTSSGEEEDVAMDPNEDRTFHVVISAQGSATHWQSRIHYYFYKKIKKQCAKNGKCEMGGFTRILHSGEPDELMDEIPTFVAKELPPEHPHHGYIVLNRPYAFLQWIQKVKIPEKYVLMCEPDHLWLKPMPNLMKGHKPAAFPFFYIEPTKKNFLPITERFVGPLESVKEKEQLAPIGSSPTMLTWNDLEKVVPIWFNLSIAIHNDEEAVKEWGWVQEMYAFTLSMYKAGIRDIGLHLEMMSQPPYDTILEKYYILHYTYGMDYDLDGKFTPGKYGEWRFDKRSYASLPPPRHLSPPPDGMKNDLVRHLIKSMNEATDTIPGWDEFAKTGKATQLWDGKTFANDVT